MHISKDGIGQDNPHVIANDVSNDEHRAARSDAVAHVGIISARGLQTDLARRFGGSETVFCSCGIRGKSPDIWTLAACAESPHWHCTSVVPNYVAGSDLRFIVWDSRRTPIGLALLGSPDFHPQGFCGELPLVSESGQSISAFLRIRVTVETAEKQMNGGQILSEEVVYSVDSVQSLPADWNPSGTPKSIDDLATLFVDEDCGNAQEIDDPKLMDNGFFKQRADLHARQMRVNSTSTSTSMIESKAYVPPASQTQHHKIAKESRKKTENNQSDFFCGGFFPAEPKAESAELEFELRRRQSGCVAKLVKYEPWDIPQADFTLCGGGGKKVIVSEISEGGPAHRAGVKHGDVLASIDGRSDFANKPAEFLHASICSPTNIVFLGFVGRPAAEVQLSVRARTNWGPQTLAAFGGGKKAQVTFEEHVAFQNKPSTVLLTTDNPPGMGGVRGRLEESCVKDQVECRAASPGVFELGRDEALRVVRGALTPPRRVSMKQIRPVVSPDNAQNSVDPEVRVTNRVTSGLCKQRPNLLETVLPLEGMQVPASTSHRHEISPYLQERSPASPASFTSSLPQPSLQRSPVTSPGPTFDIFHSSNARQEHMLRSPQLPSNLRTPTSPGVSRRPGASATRVTAPLPEGSAPYTPRVTFGSCRKASPSMPSAPSTSCVTPARADVFTGPLFNVSAPSFLAGLPTQIGDSSGPAVSRSVPSSRTRSPTQTGVNSPRGLPTKQFTEQSLADVAHRKVSKHLIDSAVGHVPLFTRTSFPRPSPLGGEGCSNRSSLQSPRRTAWI